MDRYGTFISKVLVSGVSQPRIGPIGTGMKQISEAGSGEEEEEVDPTPFSPLHTISQR